jgi:hypothetical protein
MLKTSLAFIKKQQQLSNLIIYGIGQAFNLITPLLVIPYIVIIKLPEDVIPNLFRIERQSK